MDIKIILTCAMAFACSVSHAQEISADDTVSVYVPSIPRDRIDTIYYNKDWRTTSNKAFANYYRLALYPADNTQQKEFKTYYITGELEGEGRFEKLDKSDDAKSVFEGEVIKYYKSGQVAEQKKFSLGKLSGEYISYYMNGYVKEHVSMVEGRKEGLLASFTEDGQVCRITPYRQDSPGEFYVIVDAKGNYSKYNLLTDELILETPSMEELEKEYKNGTPWLYYNKNGLIVGVSNAQQKELGGYRELGIFIVNKSMANIDIDPERIDVYAMKNGKRTNFKLVDADEYDKKILKQKKQLAKREKHPKKVMVVYEHENNVNANLGAKDFNAGTSNTIKAFQERVINLKTLTGENRMRYAERLPEELGYLERTTVHPGEIITGYLYTSDRKVNDLFVKVTIDGIDYLYEWKTEKK